MQIRLATRDDVEIISALNSDVQKIHTQALPHIFKPPTKDTFPLCLKAEYQTKEHGAKLMEAVKALAKEKGIKTLALDVWSFNTKARAFFSKQGLVTYNERMWQELAE